jgi:hypothetical protein
MTEQAVVWERASASSLGSLREQQVIVVYEAASEKSPLSATP